MVRQKVRGVLVGQLSCLRHELDHIAAALTVAETPEAIEVGCDDEAAIGRMRANWTRASQLGACLLQWMPSMSQTCSIGTRCRMALKSTRLLERIGATSV